MLRRSVGGNRSHGRQVEAVTLRVRLTLVAVLVTLGPGLLRAQEAGPGGSGWLFPDVSYFRAVLADPHDPRLSIGLIRTNLFGSRGPERPAYVRSPGDGAEIQAAAAIGATFPVFHVSRSADGGLTIGAQAGVFARFRIEHPSRDDLGQDWFIGMPIDAAWGESSLRFRLIHHSSHLGDEFIESTGGRRVEVGGEAFDLLLARQLGAIRVYGGGGWVFHSNTATTEILRELGRSDRLTLHAGLDGEWKPFAEQRLSVRAGADWQSAQRTGWRSMWALAGGLRADVGHGSTTLLIRYTGGQSALGQFFLTGEEVWTLEVGLSPG